MKGISETTVILIIAIILGVILLFVALGGTGVLKTKSDKALCEGYIQDACRFGNDPSNFMPHAACVNATDEPVKSLLDSCIKGDSGACAKLCQHFGFPS